MFKYLSIEYKTIAKSKVTINGKRKKEEEVE
jgi:hypothetical protein